MHLEIITPEKKIFEGDVSVATFLGVDGSFQLLDNHAPLVGLLKRGVVEYKTKESTHHLQITGGVVETCRNQTVLLADGADGLSETA